MSVAQQQQCNKLRFILQAPTKLRVHENCQGTEDLRPTSAENLFINAFKIVLREKNPKMLQPFRGRPIYGNRNVSTCCGYTGAVL